MSETPFPAEAYGREINTAWCDGVKAYKVYIRPKAATFWKEIGFVGHSESTPAEVVEDAYWKARKWIENGGRDQ